MSEILLPTYLSARSASETVGVCCQLLTGVEDDVLINAEQLKFVDPFGLAMLGASVHMLQENDREVKVLNLRPQTAVTST